MLAMKFFRRAIAALGSLGALTSACCAAGSADATLSTSVSTNVNTPAPIEVRVLDADETLYNSGTYFNPQNMGNGVWSIGHQRQGGTYEVPIELKNISAGEDLGLFVSVVLAADDWIVEQDPSGSVVDVGESAYARIRLDTAAPMASPSICAIQLIITQGSTSYDPILIVLRAESVELETLHPSGIAPSGPIFSTEQIPSWCPPTDGPTGLKPAANFTRASHVFIGPALSGDDLVQESLQLGVHAAIEGGINRVEFYINGTTHTVSQEALDPSMPADQAVAAFYMKIDKNSFPTPADPIVMYSLYARVFANDPTLLPRVIGPWTFYVVSGANAFQFIDCASSTSTFAQESDPANSLWKLLHAGLPGGNPVKVLELRAGRHILPTSQNQCWSWNGTVHIPKSIHSSLSGLQYPLVIRPAGTEIPDSVVLITSQKFTPSSPSVPLNIDGINSPGDAMLRPPIAIYRNLVFDQSKVRTLLCDKTVGSPAVAMHNIWLNCHFTNTSVTAGFPQAPLNQGRDSSSNKVTRLYFEDCVFGDDPLTPADEGSIYRGANAAELLWRCRFGQLSHDATNNAVAMFKCVIRDVNAQPPRSDIPVGRLTYTGSGPGHIRKTGSSGQRYDVIGTDVVGALLLYENNLDVPAYVIALDGTLVGAMQLPSGWGSTKHSVSTLDALASYLANLGSPWSFTPSSQGVSSTQGPGLNARSPQFLTCPCQGGGSGFGSIEVDKRIKDVVLSTMIDAHNDALQWFADSYTPTGGSPTLVPTDNRTYWSVDVDSRPVDSSLLYPTSPNYAATGGPFPLGYGDLVTASNPLTGPQPNTHFVPGNPAMPCGDVGSSASRIYAYPQGIIINDAAPGVFNSAMRAVRMHIRDNYNHAPTGSQFGAPMTNTLVTNVSLVGQSLALRNDDPAPYRFFDPLRLTIRDSSFLCIGLTNFYPITDPPNAQWLCCGTLNGTVPPQYNIGEILASNNHYVFVCGSTTCNQITPWSEPGNPMGFCVQPSGAGPAQPTGGQLGVYAAPGLDTGGDNTWGYGELLNADGRPLLLSGGMSSPMVRRTHVVRLKYYLDGEPVDACGSTNGADPIGPLGSQP